MLQEMGYQRSYSQVFLFERYRVLNCGHSLCAMCLKTTKPSSQCSQCHHRLAFQTAEERDKAFPKNFMLMNLIIGEAVAPETIMSPNNQ